MTGPRPLTFGDAEACVEAILSMVGSHVVLGLPLGLGKPNHIANALYERAAQDASVRLEILTALTLGVPRGRSELERRFLGPLFERLAGNYPALLYDWPHRQGRLPPNVTVHDFFLPAGRRLSDAPVQQSYVSANYTHVVRDLLARGVNVAAQLVARRRDGDRTRFSLSCNTDISLDLFPALMERRRAGHKVAIAAQINDRLPFMLGPAMVEPERFDLVLDGADCQFDLFPLPKQPVSLADYAAALHVATLIEDGGTLQIGIGSFADALTQALKLRHCHNRQFRDLVARLGPRPPDTPPPALAPFTQGLYASSEMLVEGLLTLKEIGVVKRRAPLAGEDAATATGPVIHAAFFLGAQFFYERLRAMPDDELADIAMTAISFVNHLHGEEALKRAQRHKARFVNNALMATLLGAAVSDGLADGRVISGVGGQYNFVAMAHELAEARSIIALKAARTTRGRPASNVVWNYGHVTIPRHLRDMVATEYGVADLRGRSDAETIAAMLSIADSRFQDGLLSKAKAAGKIGRDHRIGDPFRENRPERIAAALAPARAAGLLPDYPLGSDMTAAETDLARALATLQDRAHERATLARWALAAAMGAVPDRREHERLDRLGLGRPRGFKERVLAWTVLSALRHHQP